MPQRNAFPTPEQERNPYAPPRSASGREWLPIAGGRIGLTVGDLLSWTWEIYRGRMDTLIAVVFACEGLSLLALFLVEGVREDAPGILNLDGVAAELALGIATLIAVVFVAWIHAGLTIVLLDIARGEETNFRRLFRGGRYTFRVVMVGFACVVAGGLICVPTVLELLAWRALKGGPTPSHYAMGLLLIANVVLAFLFGIRMTQVLPIIVDRDASLLEALGLSFRYSRGNSRLLLVVGLVAGLINLAGVLTCLVGLVLTLPFSMLLFVITYLALTADSGGELEASGDRGVF